MFYAWVVGYLVDVSVRALQKQQSENSIDRSFNL